MSDEPRIIFEATGELPKVTYILECSREHFEAMIERHGQITLRFVGDEHSVSFIEMGESTVLGRTLHKPRSAITDILEHQ